MSSLKAQAIDVQRGGRKILHGVTLEIQPGKVTALVGPNGSGKSTLLRSLCGLWPASQGEVILDQQPVSKIARQKIAQHISFVPQDSRMDFTFTVEEMVGMGRHPHRGDSSRSGLKENQRAIDAALDRCDLQTLRHRTVTTLSGGERQRVLIARSLAVEPDVILLDEPTANLDIQHVLEILDLCGELAQAGRSVVIATHDLNSVIRHADQIAVMDSGRLVHYGPCSEALTPQIVEKVFGVQAQLLIAGSQSVYVFDRKEK